MDETSAEAAERRADRAAQWLAEPEAWLEPAEAGYALRRGQDRRRRSLLRLSEADFAALTRRHGLTPRAEGGWRLARLAPRAAPSPAEAQPQAAAGPSRQVEPQLRLQPDGVRRRVAVNLGESPIAWLARRKDKTGQPFLDAAEALAGERLREAFERAGLIGQLTMNWSAQPQRGRGGGARLDPAERCRRAKAEVAAALEAVGPGLQPVLERVCLMGSALEAAERDLNLPRRSGKTALKAALRRLAQHYRLI